MNGNFSSSNKNLSPTIFRFKNIINLEKKPPLGLSIFIVRLCVSLIGEGVSVDVEFFQSLADFPDHLEF